MSQAEKVHPGIIYANHCQYWPDTETEQQPKLPRKWNTQAVGIYELRMLHDLGIPFVFSGGACNQRGQNSNLIYNPTRDRINSNLNHFGMPFFDPQIWGREYDPKLDGDAEKYALEHAAVSLFQISPFSFGGVSVLEMFRHQFSRPDAPRVIYFSQDHSRNKVTFNPRGNDEQSQLAHYKDAVKAANSIRREFLTTIKQEGLFLSAIADGSAGIITTNSEEEYQPAGIETIEITPYNIHASDLIDAYIKAKQGGTVVVQFSDASADSPKIFAPELNGNTTSNVVNYVQTLTADYKQQGDIIRRLVLDCIPQSIATKFTFSKITAIEELDHYIQVSFS